MAPLEVEHINLHIDGKHEGPSKDGDTEEVEVVVVGMGFSGIAAAIKLKEAKIGPMLCLEREEEVGGTWKLNTYPGCACDVPSHLYSLSFQPSTEWTRMFPQQPEILAYLRDVVRKTGLHDSAIRYRTEMLEARWVEGIRRWELTVRSIAKDVVYKLHTRFLVQSFVGTIAGARPDIKGLDTFEGPVLHTGQWDHTVDLKGKRVAVIGTGASGIQVVPAIAPIVSHLAVFQRSPPWITWRNDYAFSGFFLWLLRTFALLRLLFRWYIFWVSESGVTVIHNKLARKIFTMACERHLCSQVKDTALRDRLRPTYELMCKRRLLSDDYYPALQLPHVELVDVGIAEVTATGIIDSYFKLRPVDVIVLATGFNAELVMAKYRTVGASGETLQDTWAKLQGWKTHMGITCAGFPNMFLMLGPNTFLGHNSVLLLVEAQVKYMVSAITQMRKIGATVARLKPSAQDAFHSEMRRRMEKTVWVTGGCHSWYKQANDQSTSDMLWPGGVNEYRRRCTRADMSLYELSLR